MKTIKGTLFPASRRDFLAKTAATLAGMAGAATASAMASTFKQRSAEQSLPANQNPLATLTKGQKFNESVLFADRMTGRLTRRLTQYRPVNMTPTYHLNTCFSADSSYMVLYTLTEDGGGALLRAEVATGDMTVIEVVPKSDPTNTSAAFVQATGTEALLKDSILTIYTLATLEERVVLRDAKGLSLTAASIDGKKLFAKRRRDSLEVDGAISQPVTHLSVDIATGEIREIFAETKAQCEHVIPCPSDPDLLLIDRDFPPMFGSGGDNGKTSRVWILNIKTGKLTEVRPNDSNRYPIHSNWSYTGDYVYYHGRSGSPHPTSNTGHYIGVADKNGKVVWEGHFPTFFYGHTGTHTRANIIITDGLFTRNLITGIHWEERNSQNIPRIEILVQHDTNWAAGQESHPHPHVSPDGKWLSYNRGETIGPGIDAGNRNLAIVKDLYGKPIGTGSRSDVYVVQL